MKLIVTAFLIAFVCANLLVKHFGAYGLWISSAILIPFDFVTRCIIHEKYSGSKLILLLSGICCLSASITMLININAVNIAIASVCGFCIAQIIAGVFYQAAKEAGKSYLIKVNGSDLFGIIADSFIFQIVAFTSFNFLVTFGQIGVKFLGGLLWYWIIFVKLKPKILFRNGDAKSFFQQQLEKDNEEFETKFKQNEK